MSLGNSIRSGVSWILVGNVGTKILSMAVGIVLARLLAPQVFGLLLIVQIFTGLAGFVATGGLGQALVRAEHVDMRDFDVVFTIQLVIGCFIYSVFFVSSPWFASWYKMPLYTDLIRVSALSFVMRPFANLPDNLLYREMRFKPRTLAGFAGLVASSTVGITMAFVGYGVWSLVIAGLAGATARVFTLIRFSRWRPRLSLEWRRARDLARYGSLSATGDFIVFARSEVANFILSRTFGPSPLGLFNKSRSLASLPQFVTASVYQVTFRAMAKEQKNLDLNRYLYLRSITLVSVYAWPGLLALGWLALPLVQFVYGNKWVGAAAPLAWFALVGPFRILDMLAGSVLAARDSLDREIPVQIAKFVMAVLGAIAGLPHGIVGVAIGVSFATVYGAAHMSWLAARCLSMPVRRIIAAIRTPLLLNVPVLLLWFAIDRVIARGVYLGDFLYLALMLGSGGALYGALFFFAPIPNIAAERQRWIDLARKSFVQFVKA